MALDIDQIEFRPPNPADPINVSKASFRITNNSGFGYYKVGFILTLWSGEQLIGVNRVAASNLRPGDVRIVEANWFQDVAGVSRVEVAPELDILDDKNYIPPGK